MAPREIDLRLVICYTPALAGLSENMVLRSMQFAIIADPHISGGKSMQLRHLEIALQECERKGDAFVIFAGDCTAEGKARGYQRFLNSLKRFKLPWYAVRGNNENHSPKDDRFRRYLGPAARRIAEGKTEIVMIDSSSGDVPQAQLRYLRKLPPGREGVFRLLVLHHYLECIPSRCALLDICREKGIKRIIAAHQHVRRTHLRHGIREDVLTCLDPDKARESLPGYYRVFSSSTGVRVYFREVTLPAETFRQWQPAFGFSQVRSDEPLVQWASLCRKFGFRFLQLRMSDARHLPREDELRMAQRLEISLIAHLPTPAFDEGGNLLNLKQLRDCLHWGNDRAAFIILHPPKLPADVFYQRGIKNGAVSLRIRDRMRTLLTSFGNKPIAVENNSSKSEVCRFGSLPHHLLDFARWLGLTDMPHGFCYDVGHAKASQHTAQVFQWFQSLGDRMLAMHLHTGEPSTRRTHEPVRQPFTWTSNWYGILASAVAFFPKAPLIIETRSIKSAEVSARTLLRLVAALRKRASTVQE